MVRDDSRFFVPIVGLAVNDAAVETRFVTDEGNRSAIRDGEALF